MRIIKESDNVSSLKVWSILNRNLMFFFFKIFKTGNC